MRIAVLMTCYNRKRLTKRCLQSLYLNIPATITMDIYLVDDGCTDGTGDMVKKNFPQVNLIEGSGSLFWNGGMHLAFSEAVKQDYDFYMWVNDDVTFFENPVRKMIETYNELSKNNKRLIIVGPVMNATMDKQTYGGIVRQKSIIPLKLAQIPHKERPVKCDTFHGNCVLIHKSVVEKIGIMDPFYQHAFGDADYGLQATRNGCEVWMCNYPVGICERHDKANKWLDPTLSYRERRAAYHAKTANPYRDWKYFCKKFCGWNWWLRYWAPDVKLLINTMLKK